MIATVITPDRTSLPTFGGGMIRFDPGAGGAEVVVETPKLLPHFTTRPIDRYLPMRLWDQRGYVRASGVRFGAGDPVEAAPVVDPKTAPKATTRVKDTRMAALVVTVILLAAVAAVK